MPISSLHHLADGDAGPAGDDFADDLLVDADPDERRFALQRIELVVESRRVCSRSGRHCQCGCGGGRAFGQRLRRAGSWSSSLGADFADVVHELRVFVPALR